MQKYYSDLGFDPFDYMPETHLIPLVEDFEQIDPFKNFLLKQK
jgi:hypothetical protein